MAGVLRIFVTQLAGLYHLAGPIFDKELRVSSRRRRNYTLRFFYPILMLAFVLSTWSATASLGGSASSVFSATASTPTGCSVFRASRMSEVAKHIVSTVVWFQFLAAQLLAVIMLSTAISDEIHHRTLGVLMTTPISSLQIIVGKLCSKLLQIVLVIGISLPLLAIVRIFGGVSWEFVVSSLCVILTASIFAGAISLFFSISTRRSHDVAIKTAVTCLVIYGLLAAVASLMNHYNIGGSYLKTISFWALHINPFAVMIQNTYRMLYAAPIPVKFIWPLHCLALGAGSLFFLSLGAWRVRRAGLKQATGQPGLFASRKERRAARRLQKADKYTDAPNVRIRRVKGRPLLWKEMKKSFLRGSRLKKALTITVAVIVLTSIYTVFAAKNSLGERPVQIAFVVGYSVIGLMQTASFSGSSISTEREARTWPLLLTCPLGDNRIILDKVLGSCLRVWPVWLLLACHLVVFSVLGFIHPAVFIQLPIPLICFAFMFSALGVFFSSCFKRTASASALTSGTFVFIMFPVCCSFCVMSDPHILLASPTFVVGCILTGTAGTEQAGAVFSQLEYEFPSEAVGFWQSTVLSALIAVVEALVVLPFLAIAECNVRRKIF